MDDLMAAVQDVHEGNSNTQPAPASAGYIHPAWPRADKCHVKREEERVSTQRSPSVLTLHTLCHHTDEV